MWLSLVERCVRDAKAAGSNPVIPTNRKPLEFQRFQGFLILMIYPGFGPGKARAHIRMSGGHSYSEWSEGDREGSRGESTQAPVKRAVESCHPDQ